MTRSLTAGATWRYLFVPWSVLMRALSLDLAAHMVLSHFPQLAAGAEIIALGNHGGFSGARLWRVEQGSERLCLRAWPPAAPTTERLARIHHLITRARRSGCNYVPALLGMASGATWIAHANRLWELTSWMPGRPELQKEMTRPRLEAACTALAHLHLEWAHEGLRRAPSPAIRRRIEAAHDWINLITGGWQLPEQTGVDPEAVHAWSKRAWNLVRAHISQIPRQLAAWANAALPVQYCLCDIRVEHVLFVGEAVSGLVDFGSVKADNVSVDLARLLAGVGGPLRHAALAAYTQGRSLSPAEEVLISVLEETGPLLAAANWLRWLYRDEREFEDRAAVARRLEELVELLEARHVAANAPGH